jgi:hypothetical protein
MIPDLDEKVLSAHLALLEAVEAEHRQHTYAHATPLNTSLPQGPFDRSTPRAQTRQEVEEDVRRRSIRKSANLAGTYPKRVSEFY